MKPSWVDVSLSRLRRNLEAVRRRLLPHIRILAVVKADAYGHGLQPVARCLSGRGIRDFAVATLEEGVSLRDILPQAEILVFGGCLPGEEAVFRRCDLTAAVFDDRPLPADLKVAVEVDTGLTRLGIPWRELPGFLQDFPGRLTSVYSHLAAAEVGDQGRTRVQLRRFLRATEGLNCLRHLCNSAGISYPPAHLDAVRPGLALYGIAPRAGWEDLEPILCWKTRVLSVREVPRGSAVGYGRTFVTRRRSRIGVLPVGYADGYHRSLSNRGQVRVADQLVPAVGRISMDLMTVDLTDVPGAAPGVEAVLLEADAASPISAPSLARLLETIPYEILTTIGPRVERRYVDD